MRHLTPVDLELLRSGRASAEEATTLGRHIAECGSCAAAADEALGLRAAAQHFDSIVGFDGEPADSRESSAAKPRAPWWMAAAAAIAVVVAALFFMRTGRPPIPSQPEPPRIAAPVPRTAVPVATTTAAVQRDPDWDALVAKVRGTRRLPLPSDIRELGTPDRLRGPNETASSDSFWPAATAITEDRPVLHWPSAKGAAFIVMVGTGGLEIARSDRLDRARWQVPAALRRGRTYEWQVVVERDGESFVLPRPPAPPALFRVLEETIVRELERAAKEAADDPFLLAALYARAGVIRDARRELVRYQQLSGDPLATELLRQLPRAP